MQESFDPYYRWLGIPPSEQPAHYYRLLGIELFEADPDVISHAADARMNHLRTFRTGPHGRWAEKLLREIAAARICLLDPKKKAQYDAQLRAQLAGRVCGGAVPLSGFPPANSVGCGQPPGRPMPIPVGKPLPAPHPAFPTSPPWAGPQQSRPCAPRYVSRRGWETTLVWIILITAGSIGLAGLFVWMVDQKESPHRASSGKIAAACPEEKPTQKHVPQKPKSDRPNPIQPPEEAKPFDQQPAPSFKPTLPSEKLPKNLPPQKLSEEFQPPLEKSEKTASSPPGLLRRWQDRQGKPICHGRFGDLRGNLVELVDEHQKPLTVAIQELHVEDQKFIDTILTTRGKVFLLLLSAVPVTKTVEETLLGWIGIPLEENREAQVMGLFSQTYQIEQQVPISRTLEELKSNLAYFLEGKTLRLKAKITGFHPEKNTIQFDIPSAFEVRGVSPFWKVSFRTSIKPPRAFLKDLQPQVGDELYFQGKFTITIEACPKCGGTGIRSCPECLNGFKQKTVLLKRKTPDGKTIYFPGPIQIPCECCKGMGKVPCDHFIAPRAWNPASASDKTRWVIGQLRFSRAHLLEKASKDSSLSPQKLFAIQLKLASDTAFALCFHLKEMEVGLISQGQKKVIIRSKN